MIMLKNHYKLMWNFTHDISNIFCKSITLVSLLDNNAYILLILSFEYGFELQVILLRLSRYNTTFVFATSTLDDFSTIADNIDGNIGKG